MVFQERRQVPFDPFPWYVEEADEGKFPGQGRYTMDQYIESANEGEHGGNIYNLAVWKPDPGYEQDQRKYRLRKIPGKTLAESNGIEVDPKAPGGSTMAYVSGAGSQRSTLSHKTAAEREYEGYADA